MASFTPPDIITSIDNENYRSEINQNFTLIDDAFVAISNLIPQIISQGSSANLTWIERAIRSEGVVGNDGFIIALNTDGDVFSITHNAPDGYSSCVYNSTFFQTDDVYEKSFSDLCTTDGTWDLVFGIKARGAPVCEMKLVVDGTDVDLDIDLPIWRFSVTRSGTSYTLSNLRLQTDTLMNKQAFVDVYDFHHAFTYTYSGTLPGTTGALPTGWIIPFDAEIEGAYMRIETAPDSTDGLSIDIYHDEGTDSDSVLAAPATWSSAEARTVKTCTAQSQPVQITAGTYLYPYVLVADATAANLTITLEVRKIAHQIF